MANELMSKEQYKMSAFFNQRVIFTVLASIATLSPTFAAPIVLKETFTHTGNHFYGNTSHVLRELPAPTLGDVTGFCSKQCMYDLQCNGFEVCTLSGGSQSCRLANGASKGSLEFQAGEICHYYDLVRYLILI